MKKQEIHFLTYGNNDYFIQRHHLRSVAESSGFFKTTKALSFNDLDRDFKKKYYDILKFKKGGGYWIWKHHVIQNTLKQLSENDLLVWSDAGSSFNYFAKEKFEEYVELLNSSSENNLRFKMLYKENEWTSRELFNYFSVSPESSIGTSGQYHATHMIFKKDKNLEEYFYKYKKLLNEDPFLITDKYQNNQISNFKENRHDQSIFSLLSKTLGCVEVSRDEACSSEILDDQHNYPFLSTRTKYTSLQKIKFLLFYGYYKSKPVYFNDKRFWFQRPSLIDRIKYKLNNL